MEDAATAEISRSQIWQWVHGARRAGHRRDRHPRTGRGGWSTRPTSTARTPTTARRLFAQVALDDEFVDFLTIPAYALID